ncbi:MAG: AMP-binding protein [Candidatus Bathyarchaeia archaeon]
MSRLRKLIDVPFSLYYQQKLEKDQWNDPEELRKIQFKKLKALLRHAYNYVPRYHKAFFSAGIKPDDIKTFKDLRRLPLVTRRDVQQDFKNFITNGLDLSKLTLRTTSGSTGIPLKIVSDKHPTPGSTKYPFFENGVKLRDNFVTIWGRAQSIIWGSKATILWGDISETIVPLFSEQKLTNLLKRIKPDVILTFPSVLLSLSPYDLSGINPRLIFTQGEIVTPHCRYIVKKKFGLDLFEIYGSVEFGIMAFECVEHLALHTITDNVYIELLDKDGEPVSPEEQGEIVVTGLHNYNMPLIRYKIGDIGVFTNEICPCGRSWPLLKSIQGRSNDLLILPSGRKISWLYLQRFIFYDKEFQKNLLGVSQYQIVQDNRSRITINVVKGPNFDLNLLLRIKKNIEEFFAEQGEKLEVTVEIVKEISMEKTGKRRLFISKLL